MADEPTSGAAPGLAVRVGAVMWLVQPLSVLVEFVTASRVSTPYSFLSNTISDLGVTTCTTVEYHFGAVPVCSPWWGLMNGAFVVFGLLLAGGALLTRRRLPAGPLGTAAVWLWVISGLSAVGTGLVPLDRDLDLHVLVALPVLVAQPLALAALGLALRRRHPAVGRSTLVVAGISAIGAVVFLARIESADLGGLFERLALWPGYLWLPVVAVTLLRRPRG